MPQAEGLAQPWVGLPLGEGADQGFRVTATWTWP